MAAPTATMEDGTPVVWPTSPDDDDTVDAPPAIKQEPIDDDSEATDNDEPQQPSQQGYFSHWFGGEVATEDHGEGGDNDDEDMATDDLQDIYGTTSAERAKSSGSKKRPRHQKRVSDDDPDWTEENDRAPARKRAAKIRQQSRSQVMSGGSSTSSSTTSTSDKGFSQRFRFMWTEEYQWLRYDATNKLMFCRVCQQAGRLGEFSTQGCNNFSKLALHVHNGSKEHVEAERNVTRLTSEGAVLSEPMGSTMDDDANDHHQGEGDTDEEVDTQNMLYSESALMVALKTAYFAAHQPDSERQTTQVYSSMMALQDSCNVQGAKELRLARQPVQMSTLDDTPLGEDCPQPGYAFGDEESLAEMHDVLARIVQEDLYSKISQSPFIAVVIQEHPDADLQPGQTQLVVHARYTHRGKVCVGFLAAVMVPEDSTAETVDAVMRVLNECELPVEKVVAVQIQCPRKSGQVAVTASEVHHWAVAKGFVDLGKTVVLVSAQKHPPWNACITLALQKLEEGTKYQHLLGRLVTFLQGIANKLEAIEPLKDLINDPVCQWDGLQMPPWMMIQKIIKVVCSVWPTLIEVLETEASSTTEEKKDGDNQAKHLLEDLQKYQFLAFVHFLLDVIAAVRDFEVELNYKTAEEACQHITGVLNDLQENPGENEHSFANRCDSENTKFCDHRMYFTEQQRARVELMRVDLAQDVIEHVEARCNVLVKGGVRRAFRILNPKVLAALKEYELGEFGREDLRTLIGAFYPKLDPLLNDFFPEYQEMKLILYNHHKNDSYKVASEKLGAGKNQSAMLSKSPRNAYVTKLLHCALTVPGVCVKADQHVGKLLKQSHDFMEKYGTDATTLSRMMIATHGQKMSTFDFVAALQEWNSL